MRGEPYIARLMGGGLGLRKPSLSILGADVAGQVEAVGGNVTEFRPGDEVFAMLKQGGFAEYVCVPEGELAPKPKSLSFEQAAAVPMAANTALLGLRDSGRIQSKQRVLINGASGGVGTFAVQIARAFGAEVTGVCGTRNVDLVRSLGADEVIDYTAVDFTRNGQRYDLLLDIAGSCSGSACRRALTRKGTLVTVGGPAGRWLQPAGHVFATLAGFLFASQRAVMADVVRCTRNKQNLMTLTELIEDGKVTPVIDRSYPLEELPAAMSYQEEGHASGKVVVTI
jgi:NADPH:quinone reductase-like Zn-dependent oxidoreductase